MRYLLLLVIPYCFAQNPQPGTIVIPNVELHNVHFDQRYKTVTYEITNNTSKHISRIEVQQWDMLPGKTTWTKSFAHSPYIGHWPADDKTIQAIGREATPIAPGETRKFTSEVRSAVLHRIEPLESKLELSVVFFTDGTKLGDPEIIAAREKDQNTASSEWVRWMPRIDAIKDASDTMAALRQLHDEILEVSFVEGKQLFGKERPGYDHAGSVRDMIVLGIRNLSDRSGYRAPRPLSETEIDQWIANMRRDAAAARTR